MKLRLHISVCFLAIASATCAFGVDDADELALLMLNRTEIEAEIRENYQSAFAEFSTTAKIKEAVDKHLQSEFPWAELQALVATAIRSSFTPGEQKQILSFLNSPAGMKYRSIRNGLPWKSVADLFERESQSLFAAIERAIEETRK